MKIQKLNLNDIVQLEGRLYRVCWSEWNNGREQGNKAILKLLREKDLYEIITGKKFVIPTKPANEVNE